jgi:LmbE family N-acetylglucosaminyl deacetylase|tara:strand:+ start:650 stop:1369 length:720 start_codon:yes stop_codon:yes gene_type:complete
MPIDQNPQPAYNKAMIVVAHPDDAEYGCSGTAAKWCSQGWEVVYVMCTDGSKGSDDPNMTPEKLTTIRYKEQEDAAKILGLKTVEFLGYPDAYLTPSLELRKDITRQIRKHKPDILICQAPFRTLGQHYGSAHPDHLAAGEASLASVYPTARDRLTFPELLNEGYEPHKVREVWVMSREDADHFNSISEESMQIAVKALAAHKSQVSEDGIRWTLERKKEYAKEFDADYVESFKTFVLR